MTKPVACRVGRHHWEIEKRQVDPDESPQTVRVCARCGALSTGASRLERSDPPGTWSGPPNVGGGF
jgi:hypothetical protein